MSINPPIIASNHKKFYSRACYAGATTPTLVLKGSPNHFASDSRQYKVTI